MRRPASVYAPDFALSLSHKRFLSLHFKPSLTKLNPKPLYSIGSFFVRVEAVPDYSKLTLTQAKRYEMESQVCKSVHFLFLIFFCPYQPETTYFEKRKPGETPHHKSSNPCDDEVISQVLESPR